MYFLTLILCLFSIFLDLVWHFSFGNFSLSLGAGPLFLMYLALRQPKRVIVVFLALYAWVVTVFSVLDFFQVFASLFIILWVMHRLRSQIYAESQAGQAVWVWFFVFLWQGAIAYLDYGDVWLLLHWESLISVVVQSLWTGVFILPGFWFWDVFYGVLRPFQFSRADLYDLGRQNKREKLL